MKSSVQIFFQIQLTTNTILKRQNVLRRCKTVLSIVSVLSILNKRDPADINITQISHRTIFF